MHHYFEHLFEFLLNFSVETIPKKTNTESPPPLPGDDISVSGIAATTSSDSWKLLGLTPEKNAPDHPVRSSIFESRFSPLNIVIPVFCDFI
ncbi:unnamed protein product [Protopolystoma xenopodis]|uniref:Uncharacterized protein n=1 Tax=Protopolystoma xenopodis TaxID=117903 RepID=A0A448WYM0_9PLAT|nr:unnamed protein product [Protopolystoma xenopodis]